MFARLFAVSLVVLSAGFTTGCGRTPGTEALIDTEERAVPYVPTRSTPKNRSVIVDGRVYLEGQAPAPFKMPEAAAPEANKGNVRVAIDIRDVSSSTGAITVAFTRDDESLFSKVWDKDALVGSTVATVAENLEPGDYHLTLTRYNKAMGVYAQKAVNTTVKAGETVDVRF